MCRFFLAPPSLNARKRMASRTLWTARGMSQAEFGALARATVRVAATIVVVVAFWDASSVRCGAFLRPAAVSATSSSSSGRRGLLAASVSACSVAATGWCARADVLPAPPDGGCLNCLGVIDGLFARCKGDLSACVSSQDDRPEVFEPPWQLPELTDPLAVERGAAAEAAWKRGEGTGSDYQPYSEALRSVIAATGGRVVLVREGGRYVRAEFPVQTLFFGEDVDDLEWYFTPDETIVQFRAERRSGRGDFGDNRGRLERIRKLLGWELVPVLRNRKRFLFFMESPFDSFGPSLYDALRPGAEPTPEEAAALSRQGDTVEKQQEWAMRQLLANDDLGIENRDGILDKATREFLRTRCDAKLQICE